MQSSTKSDIKITEVESIIKKYFPQEVISEIKELTEGLFNRAYLITGSGVLKHGVVLKIGASPDIMVLSGEKDIMRTEIAVYEMLEGKGVPMPKIYAADTLHDIIECDYLIMEKLQGVTWKSVQLNLDEAVKNRLLKELGRLTARIHKVKGAYFGYINRKEERQSENWGDAFLAMIEDSLADGKRFQFEFPYERVERVVRENIALLNEVKVPCLVDNDLFGNMFLTRDTYEVEGVIDFERSLFADPYMDFTACLTLFDDVEKAGSYIKGYEEETGRKLRISDKDRKRMDLYYLQKASATFMEGYRYAGEFRAQVQGYMRLRVDALLEKLEKSEN